MKRENKYLVLKIVDCLTYLNDEDRDSLARILTKVYLSREKDKKFPHNYVVISSKYPEQYEAAWALIEEIVKNES